MPPMKRMPPMSSSSSLLSVPHTLLTHTHTSAQHVRETNDNHIHPIRMRVHACFVKLLYFMPGIAEHTEHIRSCARCNTCGTRISRRCRRRRIPRKHNILSFRLYYMSHVAFVWVSSRCLHRRLYENTAPAVLVCCGRCVCVDRSASVAVA